MDPEGETTFTVDLDPDDRPAWGVITTQSCDIDEEGRNRKPWVQVAPVYELASDDPRLGKMRHWDVSYFAPVPQLGPNWVADLRIEIPVEKGWLAEQDPRPAFGDDDGYRAFAEFCGRQRYRVAFATVIHDRVLAGLKSLLEQFHKDAPDAYADFRATLLHLFLDLAGGDTLAPSALQLVFVYEAELPSGAKDRLDDWWQAQLAADGLPVAVLAPRYLQLGDVRFAESRKWYELTMDEFSSD
ncbi:MAG: hypothetical protein ACYDAG_11765 [Chloroflexota bacterium]